MITQEQLDLQAKFANGEEGGVRLIAIDADLRRANLSDVNLRRADLRRANLSDVNLRRANLSDVNLRRANLSGANLSSADLSSANLSSADLRRANLSGANLSGANLSGANLSSADLSSADLSSANLSGANLSGAIGYAVISDYSIKLLLRIADTVIECPTSLRMDKVHSCGATCCGGGWVCAYDSTAQAIEKLLGWNVAACLACPIPEFTGLFFSTDEIMMKFLKGVAIDRGTALKAKYLT